MLTFASEFATWDENVITSVVVVVFLMSRYSLERTVNQIEMNSELVTPALNVMTRDAASEYEMKLLSQAIDESLHSQVGTGTCLVYSWPRP